jgi:hypothetical protein
MIVCPSQTSSTEMVQASASKSGILRSANFFIRHYGQLGPHTQVEVAHGPVSNQPDVSLDQLRPGVNQLTMKFEGGGGPGGGPYVPPAA